MNLTFLDQSHIQRENLLVSHIKVGHIATLTTMPFTLKRNASPRKVLTGKKSCTSHDKSTEDNLCQSAYRSFGLKLNDFIHDENNISRMFFPFKWRSFILRGTFTFLLSLPAFYTHPLSYSINCSPGLCGSHSFDRLDPTERDCHKNTNEVID